MSLKFFYKFNADFFQQKRSCFIFYAHLFLYIYILRAKI